ncbi:MAG: aspartate carbamoyltransferase regulatory subunit [Candidatus Micrarchaeota archaeon]
MDLLVEKISQGTVIDRIDAFSSLRVLEILGLAPSGGQAPAHQYRIAAVINVPSKKMGKKDILKIEGKTLSKDEADKIALISPQATINLVEDSKVSSKTKVSLPKEIFQIASCPNPNCISHNNKPISKFQNEGGKLRCHFCEMVFEANELIL